MWFFSDVADWWDEKKHEAEQYLHEWSDGHDSWFRVAVAGSLQTMMNLGGGFVDVLRIGDGVREGTWRGVLKDGLRLLSLAGPLAKGGRGLARLLVKDPGGKICAWVSATQALRQTGVQHFATLDDIIIATGKTPGGANIMEIKSILEAVGADVRPLGFPASMAEVVELANRNPNGVVQFVISWMRPGANGVVKEAGHALYAFREFLGGVKIVDRSGRVVSALSELEDLYKGIASAKPSGAILINNSQVVKLISGASMVAVEVRALMLASRQAADSSFNRYRAMRQAGFDPKTAANPHKSMAQPKTVTQPHTATQPHTGAQHKAAAPPPAGTKGAQPAVRRPSHTVLTVKAGDTWETLLRPQYKPSSMSFEDYVKAERATNRLMGVVPEDGKLKPGGHVVVY